MLASGIYTRRSLARRAVRPDVPSSRRHRPWRGISRETTLTRRSLPAFSPSHAHGGTIGRQLPYRTRSTVRVPLLSAGLPRDGADSGPMKATNADQRINGSVASAEFHETRWNIADFKQICHGYFPVSLRITTVCCDITIDDWYYVV